MKSKLLLIALLLTTPGIWQVFFHTPDLINEWKNLPQNISRSLASKSSSNYLTNITELRWAGRKLHRNNLYVRLMYNKPLFVINEVFDLVQYATPKLFFLAGDGSQFSPRRIEPISTLLFPFWISGILYLISKSKYKFGLVFLLFLILGYISGRKNLAILLPVLSLNVYICYLGLSRFSHRKFYPALLCLVLTYGAYITYMNIWLNAS